MDRIYREIWKGRTSFTGHGLELVASRTFRCICISTVNFDRYRLHNNSFNSNISEHDIIKGKHQGFTSEKDVVTNLVSDNDNPIIS